MPRLTTSSPAAPPLVGAPPTAAPPPAAAPPEVQTLAEVAQLLRVNIETARRLAEKGEIAGAFRIGGQWRFSRRKLEEMIAGE